EGVRGRLLTDVRTYHHPLDRRPRHPRRGLRRTRTRSTTTPHENEQRTRRNTTMAGTNSSEIRIAGVGPLYVATADTKVPATFSTDTATDWASWKNLGFTSGDGVTFSKKDKLEPVDVWQAVSPVHFVYSDRDLTLKFSLMQFNEDTLPFFMGGGAVSALTG